MGAPRDPRGLPRGSSFAGPLCTRVALLALAGMSTGAAAQQGAPLAGIHHFEAVILGEDVPCGDEFNIAYAITDCGLVVGQRARFLDGNGCDPSNPSLRRVAFVYSITGQFGLPAGTLLELPNPDPIHGGFSAAFDVNEEGLIVGSVGGEKPERVYFTAERAAVWRLEAGVSPTLAVIAPPSAPEFPVYGEGGFGRLESVSSSTGGETWAAGHFGLAGSCGFGLGDPRYAASAVRVDLHSAAAYRWDSQFDHPRGGMRAISKERNWMAGFQTSCALVLGCGGDADSRAWGWTFAAAPPALQSFDRNLDLSGGNSFAAGRIEAVLDDGSAVGTIFDRVLEGGFCAEQAAGWAPGAANVGSFLMDIDGTDQGADGFKGYWANDVAQLASPLIAGRLAVGGAVQSGVGNAGALWFRPDTAAGWTTGDWQYRRVRDMVSPLKSGTETIRVRSLQGVNRFGDCVGEAEVVKPIPGASPEVTRRAVLLRAVPVGCVGDLNRDGSVGPADLAMLLSHWCNGPSCASAAAIADLNVDGQVGAADLTIFLANWGGSCSWPVCSSLAEEVPEAAVQLALESVDFAAQFVGLSDFAGYRAWRETAPAPIVRIFDGVVWTVAKGGS
jgi:hypothetical protein